MNDFEGFLVGSFNRRAGGSSAPHLMGLGELGGVMGGDALKCVVFFGGAYNRGPLFRPPPFLWCSQHWWP